MMARSRRPGSLDFPLCGFRGRGERREGRWAGGAGFTGRGVFAPGDAPAGAAAKLAEADLGVGRLGSFAAAAEADGDATCGVEVDLDAWGADGAEPEELRVGGAALEGVEVAAAEEVELVTAGGVDAATKHRAPH